MRHQARIAVAMFIAIAAPLGAQTTLGTNADSAQPVSATSQTAPEQTRPAAAPAATAATAGASMTGLRAGVHSRETARNNAAAPAAVTAATANLGQSKAMMGVGVAALIVGAIVGGTPGTIIMIGGAIIGLKGLYDYLQ